MRIGGVLLAAGKSRRFGSNKLLADAGGIPLAKRAMAAMASLNLDRAAAVVSDPVVEQMAKDAGLEAIMNPAPEMGQSSSIRAGVRAMSDMDAVLLMVADQPRLTHASLKKMMDAFVQGGGHLACLKDETHAGNPAIFSSEYFDELLSLEGDRGAKGILRKHKDRLATAACCMEGELLDADDPEALKCILNM